LYLLALWTTERRQSGKHQQKSNNCLYLQNDGGDNDSSPLSALDFFFSAVHQHSKVSFGIFRSHEIKLWFYDPRFSPKPTLNKKFLKTRKSFETRIFERRIFGQLVFIRRVSLLLKGIPSFRKVAIIV